MERLVKPYLSYDEIEGDLREIVASGILTKGQFVERFRWDISDFTGARHAFLTTSATTALWVSLKAAGVRAGDEVIVSDFSFPATANVVEDLGAVPVFADVDPATMNMLPAALESNITDRSKAVIFVDAFGNPSGLLRIRDICSRRGLVLIEDAACAFGSGIEGIRCGNVADLTCFSFHPRKLLTTGEGGAITTNNAAYADFFAIKLEHGAVQRGGGLAFVDFGYNFRMSEIQAAMGSRQVGKIGEIIRQRTATRDEYAGRLGPHGFRPQAADTGVVHNMQSVVFRVPEALDRDALIGSLKRAGIEATLGTYCLSNAPYYRDKYRAVQPNAALLEKTTITLPCYDGVSTDYICDTILDRVRRPQP